MDLIQRIYKSYPRLKQELIAAHMKISPHDYIKRALRTSFIYAVLFTVIAAFPIIKIGFNVLLALPLGIIVFYFIMWVQFHLPRIILMRRVREIDNEVLFAGRFLLIKLGAGRPLLNALDDTAKSYGTASKYFKEIVDDINFGTPIEEALERAMELSPSRYFKKILFQINNALRVGIDVTENLATLLEEIELEQALEIEKYAKKLSSLALFYMIIAVVIPSLGMTIFIVVASLLSIPVGFAIYAIMIIFIVLVNLMFMSLFSSIRPTVNI